MLKLIVYTCILLCPQTLFAGVSSYSEITPEAEASATVSGTRAEPKKKWTVMVFLSDKNDLNDIGESDLSAMAKVGSDDNINIVTLKGNMDKSGKFGTVELLYLLRPGLMGGSKSMLLRRFSKADMGDWRRLGDFIKVSKKLFPAEHYLLIVSSHGTGWVSFEKPVQGTAPADSGSLDRGIAFDDETNNHITVVELGAALKETGGVDIYASDACLMGDIAVDAQVSKYSKYIVGSEENVLNGYGYAGFLKIMANNPDISPEALSASIVKTYFAQFTLGLISSTEGGGFPIKRSRGRTLSVVRSESVEPLARGLKKFMAAALESRDTEVLKKAHKEVYRFAESESADLYDFLRIINENTTDSRLAASALGVMNYIKGRAVTMNMADGKPSGRAHGIAVYLPNNVYNPDYDRTMFGKYTQWRSFAAYLIKLNKSTP
ncbi:MAG: clostripain-related cysteine peptidase [Elusimicrobiaceae bacterium]